MMNFGAKSRKCRLLLGSQAGINHMVIVDDNSSRQPGKLRIRWSWQCLKAGLGQLPDILVRGPAGHSLLVRDRMALLGIGSGGAFPVYHIEPCAIGAGADGVRIEGSWNKAGHFTRAERLVQLDHGHGILSTVGDV